MDQSIFADNNVIGFSPHNWWPASTSKANTVKINVDEITLDFLMFYNKGITK